MLRELRGEVLNMVGRILRDLAAAAFACSLIAPAAGATLIGPTAYSGFAGSPFSAITFASFQLEDFEDGLLNVPGVSADAGIVIPPSTGLADSVENAPDGRSYYSNGAKVLTFTFSGPLPTHAGIVWTDVGDEDGGVFDGYADVVFRAFDQNGASLGIIIALQLGDGGTAPATGEDRFFGAVNTAGISAIRISMPTSADWEADHLQFGIAAVPEPGTGLLLGVGLVAFCRGRRSRSRGAQP
jgi:PEP-CTERM motif